MHHLMAKVQHSSAQGQTDHKASLDLSSELTYRMRLDHVFEKYAGQLYATNEAVLPKNFACLREMVSTFKQFCGPLEDYSLKFVKYLVQDCESQGDAYDLSTLKNKLKTHCSLSA